MNGKKSEVIVKMDEWRQKANTGFTNLSKDTVESKMKDWLTTVKVPSLKPASFDRLESTVDNHIIPRIGDLKMDELSGTIIQREVINEVMGSLGHSSVKKVYDALNEFSRYCTKMRYVMYNPMDTVVRPSQSHFESKQIEILSDTDTKAFIKVASELKKSGLPVSRYGFAFVFMLNTGIRLGEMIALEWGDITDSNEGVRINKNAIMVKSRDPDSEGKRKRVMIVQNTPKSQKSNRFIPLNSAAKEAVDALRKIKNSDRVVSTRKGTPVTPSPFQKAIDNLCAKAEINRFGLHALRHTFATKMIKKGVDIKVVSELLGHSSVKITYDIYVHVLDEQRAKAVEVVDFT